MIQKEKAHSTVAAAEQASGKAASIFHEDCTLSAAGNQGRISKLLPVGRQNAVASADLAEIVGCKSVRELQKMIERERRSGAVILSDTHGGGYYLSDDPAELRRFVRTLNARAKNTLRAAESAQMALNAVTGQDCIEGWLNG